MGRRPLWPALIPSVDAVVFAPQVVPPAANCGRAGLVSRLESAVLLVLVVLHVLPAVVIDRPDEPSFLEVWPSFWPWISWLLCLWLCWKRIERMRLCVVELELEVPADVPAEEEAGT